ncbi:MAG: hypothetical protein HRU13_02355 [Phycisphaerales bacterium]|nr:hypothetical protein [Phycisphaerales bacterium]
MARSLRTSLALIAPLVLLCTMSGCNILGPAYIFIAGPPKIQAEYDLDRSRTVAVVIDDPDSIVPSMGYRRVMLATAQELLAEKGKVREVIDARDTMSVLQRDSAQERMSVVQIGRAIGAEQVVWARVEGFNLAAATGEFRPNAQLRIKVIDVTANERAWPTEPAAGYSMDVSMRVRSDFTPSPGPEQRAAMEELAEYTGRALAEVFYTVEKTFSARAGS